MSAACRRAVHELVSKTWEHLAQRPFEGYAVRLRPRDMQNDIKLTLPYPPQLNHLYTVANGRKVLSTKGRKYREDVVKICLLNHVRPLEGNVSIEFRAFRPRKIGDLDNLQKAVFDSLKGSAFNDDKQIIHYAAYRFDDKWNPRVEVEITELS